MTIPLTQGKVAIIDDEDYEILSQYKWHFNKKGKYSMGYAQRSQYVKLGKGKYTSKTVYMHSTIVNPIKGFDVDHINGDTLDNRKSNLRIVTHKINMRNRKSRDGSTSKYVGVHLHKMTGKWRAQIKITNKTIHIGLFDTEKLAREAREKFIQQNELLGFRR